MGYWVTDDCNSSFCLGACNKCEGRKDKEPFFVCEYTCKRCDGCMEKFLCSQTGCKHIESEQCNCPGTRTHNLVWPKRLQYPPSLRELCEFAINTDYIWGAWFCIFADKKEFEEVYDSLDNRTKETKYWLRFSPGDQSQVILLYNDNFTNFDDVKEALLILKEEVGKSKLKNPNYYYKPAIITSLNIMSGDIPGLKTYIYTDNTIDDLSKKDIWKKS